MSTTPHFRSGTSDERVLREVLDRKTYRKKSFGFDVAEGESWLDLGANIGAFALYCKSKGARAECYEPDEGCFQLLKLNVPDFICHNSAVTSRKEDTIGWYRSPSPTDHSRGTHLQINKFKEHGTVTNVYAGNITGPFDGVKMDIEGSEGPIIDEGLIPRCRKLVIEYHTSRDTSVPNFVRRMTILRDRFNVISYPPELDKIIKEGYTKFEKWVETRYVQYPMADRLVFARGPR